MTDLMFPNVVGSFNSGFDRGQQLQGNQLAGNYIASGGTDQNSLNTLAKINPNDALGLQQNVQQQNQTKLVNMARLLNGVPDQYKDNVYQQLKPALQNLGLSQLPDTYDQNVHQATQAIVSAYTPASAIPADQRFFETLTNGLPQEDKTKAARIKLGLDNRAVAPAYSIQKFPDGHGGFIDLTFNKHNAAIGQPDFSAVTGQSQPHSSQPTTPSGLAINPDNMAPYIQAANQRLANGEDEATVQNWLVGVKNQMDQQAAAQGGNPNAGRLGYTPPKEEKDKPPTGYQWADASHTSLQPIAGGPADKAAKEAMAAAPGDATKTGNDYLATLDPSMQTMVKALAEGRMQFPSGAALKSDHWQQIMAAVGQYDPDFNAQDYNSRAKTRQSFTSGKDAQNMMALNQVAAHLDSLNQSVGNTSGVAVPFIGHAINSAINQAKDVSSGDVTTYNANADAVAHELRSLFAGSSGGTLAELEQNVKLLDQNNSTAQKQAAIRAIANLAQSRISLLADKYQKGMGRAQDPFQTTYPHAAQVLGQLSGASAQAAPSATPTAAPSAAGWSIQKVD